MKKLTLIILFYLMVNKTYSQTNLVPNPSFETYTACPTGGGDITKSTSWLSFIDSPDYYHPCANALGLGTPTNSTGYQIAASGSAYAGVVAYSSSGFAREIMGSLLTQSLSMGTTYYVTIKFSLAEIDANTKLYIPCDKIGVKFSTIPFTSTSPPPINNISHVYATSIINDTLNWTTVQGAFIADSNYKYIMIGNFFDDANTDTTYRINGIYSYFFVDDVCVSTSSVTCGYSTAIEEENSIQDLFFYPNPVASVLSIKYTKAFQVSLYDFFGKEIINQNGKDNLQIDLTLIPNGLYFLNIKSALHNSKQKIIINH